MMLKYRLGLAVLIGVSAEAVACSSNFSSCEELRSCPGMNSGGTGGTDDAAEAAEAGQAGSGVADPAPDSGAAGEGGGPSLEPALFGECSRKGEFACDGHASAQRFACDGVHWQSAPTCAAGQLCDSSTGECAAIVAECERAEPDQVVCRDDVPLTCGVDRVSASEGKRCVGLCKEGVCQKPVCGDEKVEPGEDCDDQESLDSGACVKCKTATCGDGVVFAEREQCDDGNRQAGDGCSATCKAEPVALALGGHSTCALSSTGLVKCWGENLRGELGQGDKENRGDTPGDVPRKLAAINLGTGRTATSITIDGHVACAVLDNGQLKCWGANDRGALGDGTLSDLGDGVGEMGDKLNPISLGKGRTVKSVSTSGAHTCVVLDDSSVKCWGNNADGQLGLNGRADVLTPGVLQPIQLGQGAKSVSTSSTPMNTCVTLEDGTAKCWGYGTFLTNPGSADLDDSGRFGDAAGEMERLGALTFGPERAESVVISGKVQAAWMKSGGLVIWGTSYNGGLGIAGTAVAGFLQSELAALAPLPFGSKVTSFGLGGGFACATLANGQLKCWGANGAGQLARGGTDTFDAGAEESPRVNFGTHRALQVAAGDEHACAILDDGTVRCWGRNASGELGLGDPLAGATKGDNFTPAQVDLAF